MKKFKEEKELLNKRRRKEKHFLQENGDIVAKVYQDDIHYEKDGKYEEIDNTLEKVENYYHNKNNSYDVYFKDNSEGNIMGFEFEGHHLSIELPNNNNVTAEVLESPSKLVTTLKYEELYDGHDFEYEITPTKVKENIIIKDKESAFDEISFSLSTDLELQLNTDKSISALQEGKDLFTLEAPYMIDSNNKVSNNVSYKLKKLENTYELDLVIDKDWLNEEDTMYPVIIDPTLRINNTGNVYDAFIYPGDTNVSRGGLDILKVGVEKVGGQDIVNRSLLKFDLPILGAGAQIQDAALTLAGYPIYPFQNCNETITVHRITEDWEENEANWSNMHDKYDSKIEAVGGCVRAETNANGNVLWKGGALLFLTSLVKKWYTDTPNYGMMLKAREETYKSGALAAFLSQDSNLVSNYSIKPELIIVYRNQNGLEDYMDYQSQGFSGGTVYQNTCNGNLIGKFSLGETVGGSMPASLDLFYNTNDVVLNNDNGIGLGYKFNLQQTIKPDNDDYLEYIDEDGTVHYFYKPYAETPPTEYIALYQEEDNPNMTITVYSNEYVLKIKDGNSAKFLIKNGIGYLTEIIDTANNKTSIYYDENNLINKIVDASNNEINLVYEADTISVESQNKTVCLNYENELLTSISSPDGDMLFTYNDKNLINIITDKNGTSIGYEYYDQTPYRVKKVTEYGVNNGVGSYFTIEYGNKTTTIVDNKDKAMTMNYNNRGSALSVCHLKEKNDICNAYATTQTYSDTGQYKNKLLSSKMPIRYVKNYLTNTSFENNGISFTTTNDVSLTISADCSYSGSKSLKAVSAGADKCLTQNINVPKGKYYTFSTYIKNTNNVKIALSYIDSNNQTVEQSELISPNSDFERYDTTIEYPSDANSALSIKVYLLTSGTTYIDNVQLEEGEVANNFNYIENSDFSNGLTGWVTQANKPNAYEVVTLQDSNTTAAKINMNLQNNVLLEKVLNISGKKGDNYDISFWYKYNGVNNHGNIAANFNHPDGYLDDNQPQMKYNASYDDWQFCSITLKAGANYDKIFIDFWQDEDINEMYITNVSMFKDVGQINYTYDAKGNLTVVTDENNDSTTMEHDNNNQIVKTTDSDGKSSVSEYDNVVTDRELSITSPNGISTEKKYDSFGNVITTRTSKKIISGDIINGLYKIRLKGTEKYIGSAAHTVLFKENCGKYSKWNLEKDGDSYKIKHSLLKNKYMTTYNNALILTSFQNNNSLFTLTKKDNGSYLIKLKNYDTYLKNNNGILEIASLDEENEYKFQFYFEVANSEQFIEENTEYTEDGKFVTQKIDSLLNKTTYDIDPITGLTMSETNPKNQTTHYEYDEKQNLISIASEDKQINYAYNSNNLLSKITDDTKEYNFTYDQFLNEKEVKIGDDILLITNNYGDDNGNLELVIFGNNHIINYEYDEFDRPKKLIKMDDVYNHYYDNNNEIVKTISNNHIMKSTYDKGKRITNYKFDDFSIKYKLDSGSNAINSKYRLGNFNQAVDTFLDEAGRVTKTQFGDNKINYVYDELGRLISSSIDNNYNTNYEYVRNGKRASTIAKSIENNGDKYSYKYDKLVNITHIYHNDVLENKYTYDKYNQLIKEDNCLTNETINYIYDYFGNMLSKTTYEINTNNQLSQDEYKYNNSNWEDQLTKYNNLEIVYDEIGNPLTIGNDVTLSWINGRQLSTYTDSTNIINYDYDIEGIRIGKTINNIETKYYLEEDNIILEKTGNDVLYYIRDNSDSLIGFKYNNDLYYYVKNYQGDIIRILDANHNIVANYQYDSWGKPLSITDENGLDVSNNLEHIANINPFRYRSYYYDQETKLYYLNDRYYNSETGRFINADGMIDTGTSILGNNMYIYCDNNPITSFDSEGQWTKAIHQQITNAVAGPVNKIIWSILKKYKCDSLSNWNIAFAALMAGSILPDISKDKMYKSDKWHGGSGFNGQAIGVFSLAKKMLSAKKPDIKGAFTWLGAGLHTIQDSTAHFLGTKTRHAKGQGKKKEVPNDKLSWDYTSKGGWKDISKSKPTIFTNPRSSRAIKLSRDYLDKFLSYR